MGHFGFTEFLIIFLIILILFGAKRIPGLFRAIGSSIRNFKKSMDEKEDTEQ
jgi:sec-independent protein translocase protein TatA